jgi:hypothetical protein
VTNICTTCVSKGISNIMVNHSHTRYELTGASNMDGNIIFWNHKWPVGQNATCSSPVLWQVAGVTDTRCWWHTVLWRYKMFCHARFTFIIVPQGLKAAAKKLWQKWDFHHRCSMFNDEVWNVTRKHVMDATISNSALCFSSLSFNCLCYIETLEQL